MKTNDCVFCGAEHPISHVAAWKNGEMVGRICAKHTFYEVIMHSDNLVVTVEELGGKTREKQVPQEPKVKDKQTKNFTCNLPLDGAQQLDVILFLHDMFEHIGATYNNVIIDGDNVTVVGLEKEKSDVLGTSKSY